MGESRNELLAWLNNLLQLNVTKIEQCGTGAALCQIYDSVFQDVPMARVKFNVNTEYGYLQNFKVLQNTFSRHSIDRSVPVEALIKCKMQDNLEFLQWTKRFWDQNYPGGDYDAVARRKASGTPAPAAAGGAARTTGAAATKRGVTPSSNTSRPLRAAGNSAGANAIAAENVSLKETVSGLERERDFYFSKLRDIELLLQSAVEADPEIEKDEQGLVKQIQSILYSTEEGFEIPDAEAAQEEELETF